MRIYLKAQNSVKRKDTKLRLELDSKLEISVTI